MVKKIASGEVMETDDNYAEIKELFQKAEDILKYYPSEKDRVLDILKALNEEFGPDLRQYLGRHLGQDLRQYLGYS